MRNIDELDFDSPETCPNCGQLAGSESTCPNCGAILYDSAEMDDLDEEADLDG